MKNEHNKILVLDDEKSYAQMLHDILSQRLFDSQMATKPEQALEMLEEEDYGLIISDFKMPVMDGADFLQRIRSINPGIPVIMVSGLMNLPELIKVANMSITLVLEKPIDVEHFIEQVNRFVKPLSKEAFEKAKGERTPEADTENKKEEEHKNWVCRYPEPEQVSDYSLSSKVFFERLWEASNYHHLIFITYPPGSEIETISAELGSWLKLTGEKPFKIEAKEFPKKLNQAFIDSIIEEPKYMNIVVLHHFDVLEIADQEFFLNFFQKDMGTLNHSKELYFLAFLSQELFEQQACLDGCKDLFAGRTVHTPPLAHRLSDLAIYIQNYLAAFAEEKNLPIKNRLSTDVISDLLHYRWPNNFEELHASLWKLVQKGGDSPIQRSEVREVLKKVREQPPSLEDFLKEKQTEAINKALGIFHGHWNDAAFALGLKGKIPQDGTAAEDLDLLHPELAKDLNKMK